MAATAPTPVPDAPTYEVTCWATPDADWLDLPALHAELLPLAQTIGHERLVLMAEVGFAIGTCYQAYGAGGGADMHVYIIPGRPESRPAEFAAVLRERLQRAADTLGQNCPQL